MDEAQLWERLVSVFRTVFENDAIRISPPTSAVDIDEWDSLNHVQLVVAVESEFGIRFRPMEVAAFECVGDMAAAIRRHGAK